MSASEVSQVQNVEMYPVTIAVLPLSTKLRNVDGRLSIISADRAWVFLIEGSGVTSPFAIVGFAW